MTARELFDALIALPREAGTPAAAAARDLLRRHLQALGYHVREQRFTFQPSALNAFPLLGAGLGWLTLLEIPLLLMDQLPRLLPPLVWGVGATALGILAWGIGTGVEVPGAERRDDGNLIATRGEESAVRRWIVAHVDTKAQGHSMAGRLLAAWVMVSAALLMTGMVVWRASQSRTLPGLVVAGAAALSLTAGVLAGQGRLRGTSPGARDNGTGLLAALEAAATVNDPEVGFLLTGAEEFGLVGARAFLSEAEPGSRVDVLNLDTLTDRGALYLVYHDDGGRRLAEALRPFLRDCAPSVVARRLPMGILTDSLPMARAGYAAVTLGRLDWTDLGRLHTPADTLDGLTLVTAESIGRAIGAFPLRED